MNEIRLYRSRRVAARFIAMCMCFNSCLFVIIYQVGFSNWMTWLFLTVFVLVLIFSFISIIYLFDKRPAIIINEIGIANRKSKYGLVNWEIIKEAYLYDGDSKHNGIIYFKVNGQYDPTYKMKNWKRKMGLFNKDLGHEVLKLVIDDIDVDRDKLLLFIQQMIELNKSEKSERQKLIGSWQKENTTVPKTF